MTYPESSYLIKLTSSESSTRNVYPICIKTINSEGRKVFRFDFQPMGEFDLFGTGRSHFFIERALAIVQQCNDHTDKRSLERSYC